MHERRGYDYSMANEAEEHRRSMNAPLFQAGKANTYERGERFFIHLLFVQQGTGGMRGI